MTICKEGQGFDPMRTSRTLRIKSAVLTPQMGVFQRYLGGVTEWLKVAVLKTVVR